MQIPTVSEMMDNMKCAIIEVFDTTFGQQPKIVQLEDSEKGQGLSAIVGLGGTISGYLALHIMPEDACMLAGNMLGAAYAQVDSIVCDAIGELVNMLAGSLKKFSCRNGELFKISIPTIVLGSDYSTHAPKDAERILVGVRALSALLTIQLVVNIQR
jgi:chemotaxis protein CheX